MRILILEDEIPAYKKLITYLTEYFKSETEHDWARTIKDGKQFLL